MVLLDLEKGLKTRNKFIEFVRPFLVAELQKCADRADQSVLFFLAGANFWEKHAKNRRKQVKTRENRQKTGVFWVLIFGGKNWLVLIFTPFATMWYGSSENKLKTLFFFYLHPLLILLVEQ